MNKLLTDVPYDALAVEYLAEKVQDYNNFAVISNLPICCVPLIMTVRSTMRFSSPVSALFSSKGSLLDFNQVLDFFQYVMDYIFDDLKRKFSLLLYFYDNLTCAKSAH